MAAENLCWSLSRKVFVA